MKGYLSSSCALSYSFWTIQQPYGAQRSQYGPCSWCVITSTSCLWNFVSLCLRLFVSSSPVASPGFQQHFIRSVHLQHTNGVHPARQTHHEIAVKVFYKLSTPKSMQHMSTPLCCTPWSKRCSKATSCQNAKVLFGRRACHTKPELTTRLEGRELYPTPHQTP